MFQDILIAFSEDQKTSHQKLLEQTKHVLNWTPIPQGPVFTIGSWQTGDFGHVYAAAVRHFSLEPGTPFSILILQAEGFSDKFLLEDAKFAIGSVQRHCGGSFSLLHTAPISKKSAIPLMSDLMKADNAREPFDATFWASAAVKAMSHGQPLTKVWSALARSEDQEWYKDYNRVCESFMKEYVSRFGTALGRENFVCLWGRTSGAPTEKQPLGGANPQYDSSEWGNHQLCLELSKLPKVRCIFTVGGGFDAETKKLPCVFDLGDFWKKMDFVKGRFQENGFFDFMTAFYDCNVVHVGMKSGGMDVLGLWGQKVVFIDSIRSPEVTKGRVLAWETEHLKPVPISEMPTKLGRAIEEQRIDSVDSRNPLESARAKITLELSKIKKERDDVETNRKNADREGNKLDSKKFSAQRELLDKQRIKLEAESSALKKKLETIPKPFKTTFDDVGQLDDVQKRTQKKADGFTPGDLKTIASNVSIMLLT